ncbi:MAG TPA: hypothetical protein PLE77_13885 [Kiritimatiellia bacterium]|nr:hypothetical protein [Kiritimatiellia bacterium]
MTQNTQIVHTDGGTPTKPAALQSIRRNFGKHRDKNLLKTLADEKKTERVR